MSGCTFLKAPWLENFHIRLKIRNVNHFSCLENLTELGIINCNITEPESNGTRFCIPIGAPRLERLIVMQSIGNPGHTYVKPNLVNPVILKM